MFPQRRYDSAGHLFRLECPFCKAESPLWFEPEPTDAEAPKPMEWEVWLDSPCRECGRIPRSAAPR